MNRDEIIAYALNFLAANLEDADVYDILHGYGADELSGSSDVTDEETAEAYARVAQIQQEFAEPDEEF